MGAIVIDELKRLRGRPKFIDVKLDIKKDYVFDPKLNNENVVKDLQVSYDLQAIKNSLFNLFTTMPGQKILNPVYGLNLYQYLFTAVTEDNAQAIGDTILKGIQKYEPRLGVVKIYVVPDFDNNAYVIGLKLNVPGLNIVGIGLKGILSDSGYYMS